MAFDSLGMTTHFAATILLRRPPAFTLGIDSSNGNQQDFCFYLYF
jgi:hypothetical protein